MSDDGNGGASRDDARAIADLRQWRGNLESKRDVTGAWSARLTLAEVDALLAAVDERDALRRETCAMPDDLGAHFEAPSTPGEDERLLAWHAVAQHPLFAECYADERPLIVVMLERLDEVHLLKREPFVPWEDDEGFGGSVRAVSLRVGTVDPLLALPPLPLDLPPDVPPAPHAHDWGNPRPMQWNALAYACRSCGAPLIPAGTSEPSTMGFVQLRDRRDCTA